MVDTLRTQDPGDWNTPNKLFESARNEVRWAYQKLVVEDFLPRIVGAEVFRDLAGQTPTARDPKYVLYKASKRGNLPREFVAAAYRFGHSGVRTGYRMNKHADNRFSIFPASGDPTPKAGAESLLGFDPITNNQVIDDWGRFFPTTLPGVLPTEDRNHAAGAEKKGAVRLQFAYKLDPTLVDPLGVLPRRQVAGEGTTQQATTAIAPTQLPDRVGEPSRPSLALLNLLRGNTYLIQGGQAVAAALKAGGLPVTPLAPSLLVTRQPGSADKKFIFKPIPAELQADTPLWFYVLAEAQAPLVAHFGLGEFDEQGMLHGIGAQTQLGWVGGRIVAEVFYGLLDADSESFVNAAPAGWKPMLENDKAPVVVRSLLGFADSVIA